MSHQSSATESLKNKAESVVESVQNTVAPPQADPNYNENKDINNFAKDAHGNTFKKGDYKDQLNQAAHGGPKPDREEEYVEKVLSSIPGISTLQKSVFEQGDTANPEPAKPAGPPDRSDHDVQVEQFLRKQYHSKSGDGMPDPDNK